MSELIIGGTSGLGLELAQVSTVENVIVTGRSNPEVEFVEFREFDLSTGDLPARIGEFVANLPEIDSLVYAAGFYQEGHVDELSDEEADKMLDVCARGLLFFTKKLLEKQGYLNELVTITSTSQWTPRELEPVYNMAKAGAAHFSQALSLDGRVDKTLVVGPSGMATKFWDNDGRDTSSMMNPAWVAEEIASLRTADYSYRFAKILGKYQDSPDRVEITETRD